MSKPKKPNKNREKAMKVLKTRLYEEEERKKEASLGAERKIKLDQETVLKKLELTIIHKTA